MRINIGGAHIGWAPWCIYFVAGPDQGQALGWTAGRPSPEMIPRGLAAVREHSDTSSTGRQRRQLEPERRKNDRAVHRDDARSYIQAGSKEKKKCQPRVLYAIATRISHNLYHTDILTMNSGRGVAEPAFFLFRTY